ncbi:Hypothetical protein GbCGDNIH3_0488 [Granulibacter bethesdensis]|uniref:Uncharacterized protein n=4 Tax=Granulibacter bethesdensis TaxID=364410 RepID=Q0BUW6_GRABC|nr:Hypothetical protein GbCGDNIH1_0488 [Granulibacter bethesdensis CGDNIH1]AHJ62260.1 Hypothetical protein GbCGDNIH3_0488 [Granulibacter bethesdensis]APH51178.1 Hypothetical protein GbCGDNIH5_0488 [Granulibacter bethesdensis]APH58800.1 Hypothetical protein GbCGDNIH7_0488 [Granulibacter bethesdensis]APH63872.1 Hypothetical protein GbCGDNIH1I4_0488 [Granulibacter bethesdensis]
MAVPQKTQFFGQSVAKTSFILPHTDGAPMTTLQSGATIIPFPFRPGVVKRLMARSGFGEAYESDFAARWGFARVTVVDGEADTDPYIALYREGESWSAWGIAYVDQKYMPWHGATGRDLGEFNTLDDAMSAVTMYATLPLTAPRQADARQLAVLRK